MLIKSVLLGLAALFMVADGSALACQGKTNAALDENFQKPDPGWGKIASNVLSLSPQGLVIQPVVNGTAWLNNYAYTLDGADFCVEVTFPTQMPTPANRDNLGDAGIAFWNKDSSSYYVATIAPDGSALISRYVNGSWSNLYGPAQVASIKTTAGATNEVELQVKGNSGTLIVNDTPVTTFHGQAPPEGGPPGVYCESAIKSVTTWVFPRVQIY
jgi:hypothetical protein